MSSLKGRKWLRCLKNYRFNARYDTWSILFHYTNSL
jgi:hypothetical protein